MHVFIYSHCYGCETNSSYWFLMYCQKYQHPHVLSTKKGDFRPLMCSLLSSVTSRKQDHSKYFYINQHSKLLTRRWHSAGTFLSLLFPIYSAIFLNFQLSPSGDLCSLFPLPAMVLFGSSEFAPLYFTSRSSVWCLLRKLDEGLLRCRWNICQLISWSIFCLFWLLFLLMEFCKN